MTAPNGTTSSAPEKLVGEEECIALVFADDVKPAPRTWRKWKKQRRIPFVKMGRLSFYDPASVRAAILKNFTVAAK